MVTIPVAAVLSFEGALYLEQCDWERGGGGGEVKCDSGVCVVCPALTLSLFQSCPPELSFSSSVCVRNQETHSLHTQHSKE